MKDVDRAAAIRGKTIRFAWTEGPKGAPGALGLHPHRRSQLWRSAAGGLRIECEGVVSRARHLPGDEIVAMVYRRH